ncbi:MAG: ABC transporter permease, partial [Gemmatimonadetes bacterium]|nr:ABC transporter permease [Gemmatimonadota bacterium]
MPIFFRRRRGQSRHGLLSRLEREVREEIRFYLEMRVQELEAEGVEAGQAWRQALKAFGDPEEVISESTAVRSRDAVVVRWREHMSSVGQDLAFALRTLWKRPLFAAAAIISLGLGIGANTAVFSVMNSLLVRPLNVAEPSKLIPVFTSQTGGAVHGGTAYPDYLDYRERNEVFSGLAAHTTAPMAVAGDGPPRVVWGQLVSWDYFQVLGVDPMLGRGFLQEEGEEFGAHPVAVLSHSTWRGQFGSDPEILGRTVRINDSPFTVIGVTPAGFMGLMPVVEPALWAP